MFDIQNVTFSNLKELITKSLPTGFKTFQSLYDGDHWRNGDGWVGPKPDITKLKDDPNASGLISEFSNRIKRQFVSKNVVREVVTRHVNGVLSRKVNIQVIRTDKKEEELSDEEVASLTEIEETMQTFMKEKKVLTKLREALSMSLYGERAVLRLFIPSGLLSEEGVLDTGDDLNDVLKNIWVDALPANDAMVYVDRSTMREYGLWVYRDENDKEKAEITFYDPETDKTIVRVMSMGGEDESTPEEGDGFTIDGRIFMYQVERPQIITEQVRQNQDLLNKSLTMWSANLDWSAFMERMILNGMPPGRWELDATTRTMEYKEEGTLKTGPNRTNYVFGQPTFNDEGQVTGMTNPSVVFREPIDPETFDKTLGACYQNILEETKQAHVTLNSESAPSGRSRRESRTEFEDDLKLSKDIIDDAGEWLLETAHLIAMDLAGQSTEEYPYQIHFNTTLKIGALSSEEQEMVIKQVENKLKSVKSAMRELGLDDVETELSDIDSISEHVTEIIEVLNLMFASSPELARQISLVLIQDKAEFLPDANVELIANEVAESLNRKAQAEDLIGATGSTGEEEEEETEEIE